MAPGASVPHPRTRYPSRQRVFDVVVVLVLIVPALLVGLLVALAVLIDSPGPVLYRSRRIGRDGVPFWMLKFRTMRHLAGGPLISSRTDVRFTPVGRFLALTRLDELPQLWNVLRGQMRLVGPRPELEEFVEEQRRSYERILTVPPGLTGPTQLVFADEGTLLAAVEDRERVYRSEILPGKVQLDLEYVASHNLARDLSLIARTCVLPLVKTGYRIAARLGAGPAQRAMAVRLATVVLGVIIVLGLFTAEAGTAL
jgi:lipopolysaccharide/colanic/teichoic acid biosynthesis glycosyltransferase